MRKATIFCLGEDFAFSLAVKVPVAWRSNRSSTVQGLQGFGFRVSGGPDTRSTILLRLDYDCHYHYDYDYVYLTRTEV